jgi:hypothetical protein
MGVSKMTAIRDKKMKRIILTILLMSMLAFLVACSTSDSVLQRNVITTAILTPEQQEIVDLLSVPNSQELLIFDFNTDEAFSSVEFWVEVYENGELVDRPAGLHTVLDVANKQTGRLAVIITQNPYYQWTLTVLNDGGRASHVSTSEVLVDSALGRGFGSIDSPVTIENGKEIILYRSFFASDSLNFYSTDTLQENPELLGEFLHAHIIKCRFIR